MSGGGKRRGRSTKNDMLGVAEQEQSDHEVAEEAANEAREAEQSHDQCQEQSQSKLMLEGLAKISGQIHDLDQKLRGVKDELKQEIFSLRQDMDRKFRENNKALEDQKSALAEAQSRIAVLEEWSTEANDELLTTKKQIQNLQDKNTDLEARARRNNIRIFGLPEDIEGGSVATYLNQLFKKELEIPEEMELQIQRAHRTPPFKLKPGERPRHIVVNFLQFEMKEMILKKAWQKKIRVAENPIQFDHDYPAEIIKKRRSYLDIKKVLKERGIRFQTPFTRIRIHWKDGIKSYNSAREAAQDTRARGFAVNIPSGEDNSGADRLRTHSAAGWQRIGGGGPSKDTAQRAREKLQEYQRQ